MALIANARNAGAPPAGVDAGHPAPGAAPPTAQAPAPGPEGAAAQVGQKVDPRDQAKVSAIVKAGVDTLFGERGLKAGIRMILAGPDPVHQVGLMIGGLMRQMSHTGAVKSRPSDEVLMAAGENLLMRALNLAAAVGAIEFSEEGQRQDAMNRAGEVALSHYHALGENPGPKMAGQGLQPPGPEGQAPGAPPPAGAPPPGAAPPPAPGQPEGI